MANLVLTLDTLGDLDQGSARLIIDKAIAEAVADVDDRGEDGKDRRVTVELTLKKLNNGQIETHVASQAKLPPRRSNSTIAKVGRKGNRSVLGFEFFSPDNPDQPAFDAMNQKRDGQE